MASLAPAPTDLAGIELVAIDALLAGRPLHLEDEPWTALVEELQARPNPALRQADDILLDTLLRGTLAECPDFGEIVAAMEAMLEGDS